MLPEKCVNETRSVFRYRTALDRQGLLGFLFFGVGFGVGAGLEFFFEGAAGWALGSRIGVMGSVARKALGRGGCGFPGSLSLVNFLACEGVSGSAKLS